MSWTAPATVTAGQLMTAAFWNTHVRDNELETAPAKVTTAGDTVYGTAANTLSRLGIGTARQVLKTNSGATAPEWAVGINVGSAVDINTRTSTSDSYEVLTGAPAVTITTGDSAVVWWGAGLEQSAQGHLAYMSVAVSSATTIAASDDYAANHESDPAATHSMTHRVHFFDGVLTPGSNVFTIWSRRSASGTATFINAELVVIAP